MEYHFLKSWLDRRRTLRELRAANKGHSRAYLAFFSEQIGIATDSLSQGNPERALQIWREMHARYSDLSLTSEKALNLLVDLGCHDEATNLINFGQIRYPRYKALYAAALARLAYRRGDLEEAISRCEVVRRDFPRIAGGYSIAALCLDELGRINDADSMLQLGVQKVPNDIDLCIRFAQAAMGRQDWTEGLRRWQIVWDRFAPTIGLLGKADCLREMGRFSEADKCLSEACERFDMNAWPFAQRALLSFTIGDYEEAIGRWEVVLERFPWFEFAYAKAAEVLFIVGRQNDADELLRQAVLRSPSNLSFNLEYARSANRRGDWHEARERWAGVRSRFPDCTEATEQELIAIAAAAQQQNCSDQDGPGVSK